MAQLNKRRLRPADIKVTDLETAFDQLKGHVGSRDVKDIFMSRFKGISWKTAPISHVTALASTAPFFVPEKRCSRPMRKGRRPDSCTFERAS